ncbi:MAG: DUF2971 domain-containing protein [Desulfocapsaceae bacterium]|nr:DUF2971 domain-containing protein [Desulfocapsaceae bacterium]
MIAYHFISEKYALDVLSDQRMKLSLFKDLNDPFELLAADQPDPDSRNMANTFKEFMAGKYGLLCFSKNWKNPLLWSHYANKHKGVALEFYIKDEFALPVTYSKVRFNIDWKEKILKKSINREETKGLWLTKFESWHYEEEIRIICNQSDCIKNENILFHPLNDDISLQGIILGPLCELQTEDIKDKLPTGKEIKVIKSRLAFRSFNIVKQERFKSTKIKN